MRKFLQMTSYLTSLHVVFTKQMTAFKNNTADQHMTLYTEIWVLIQTKSSSDISEATWSFLVRGCSKEGLVFFNPCKQFGDAVLDLFGHFKDEFFKLNPIIFKFLPSKDCFLGLLGELVFPTSLSPWAAIPFSWWGADRATDSTGTSFPSTWLVKTKETCKMHMWFVTLVVVAWKPSYTKLCSKLYIFFVVQRFFFLLKDTLKVLTVAASFSINLFFLKKTI